MSWFRWNTKTTWPDGTTPTVAIIGAGISGLCAGIQLKEQLGITTFTLYELEDDVGGTWWVNKYPGCACDIASHLYSFSFAPNPDWTEKFPRQEEMHKYLRGVVRKYDILSHIKFRTEVVSTKWDSKNNIWKLVIKTNGKEEKVTANIVISGVGALRIPNIPENLTKFQGPSCHSAQWDTKIDLKDKEVALVGSGASGIQLLPSVAPIAKHVYVYQRTPTYILPRNNYKYSEWAKWTFRYIPGAQRFYRAMLYLRQEIGFFSFKRGTMMGNVFSKIAKNQSKMKLLDEVKDEELRQKLFPTFSMGCKRIVIADNYWSTFNRDNVTLITEPILKIEGNEICTASNNQPVDALLLATGFHVDKYTSPMKVYGKSGVELTEMWTADIPKSYLGICTSDFPNMFILLGPGTGLGHNSVVFMIECQVNFIMSLIRQMLDNNYATAEVKDEVQEEFHEQLQEDLAKTVFTTDCKSWYMNKAGKVFALWSGNCTSYWQATRNYNLHDFTFSARGPPK